MAKFSVMRVAILVISAVLGLWSLGSFACTCVLDEGTQEEYSISEKYCGKFDEKEWYFYLAVTVIGWIGKVLFAISRSPEKPS